MQGAVLLGAQLNLLKAGRAIAHRQRLIEAWQHQFHRCFRLFGETRCQAALDACAKFRAESAAHKFGNDPHLAVLEFHVVGQSVPHTGDVLGRSPGCDAIVGTRNSIAMRFERVVQLHGRGIKPFHHSGAFGKGLIHFAFFIHSRFGKVWFLVPDARRSVLFRILLADDKGQLGRLHFDGPQSIQASLLRRAGDCGDLFAVIADDALAFANQNCRLDPGNLHRRLEVDFRDFGLRPFRAQNHAIEPTFWLHVGRVFRRAGDFGGTVNPLSVGADMDSFFRPAWHKKSPPFCC